MNKFYNFMGISKKAGYIKEGYNNCEELIKKRKIYLIILSKEASENTKKKFNNYSSRYKVPVISDLPKEELGRCLGLEEINIVGISDQKMAKQLIKLWEEKQ
ncbi:MAG: ribosomal protein L7Ae family protein [Firmicutes bacterium]|nr:ribosomal protein L7Ae family protein [Bacillota bacterium]